MLSSTKTQTKGPPPAPPLPPSGKPLFNRERAIRPQPPPAPPLPKKGSVKKTRSSFALSGVFVCRCMFECDR